MKFIRPPFFLKWIYPQATYRRATSDPALYLTFDDGPIPKVTPWVLDTLAEYQAKATFFCVGENVKKHPEIFIRLKEEGHSVGNHTYNHLKGWNSSDKAYLQNVEDCRKLVDSTLFRPPYLRATSRQLNMLKPHYEIVFYDVLAYDFDPNVSSEQCYKNVVDKARNGSIIVLHDNLKSFDTLKQCLPRILRDLKSKGYSFRSLDSEMGRMRMP